jgi:hypothetical protein
VFVSIVSTKIPFKGTGKEYIGDDITEIQASVKRALQSCCQQLRAHLVKKHALRDIKERKSRLVKYVPDVTRSLFGILEGMRQRQLEQGTTAAPTVTSPTKRMRLDRTAANELIEKLENNEISETSIKRHLIEAIEAQGGEAEDGDPNLSPSKRRRKNGRDPQPLYLVQLPALNSSQHDIEHSLFTFRPIKPISRQVKVN